MDISGWVRRNYYSKRELFNGALRDLLVYLTADGDIQLPSGRNIYIGGPTAAGVGGVRLHYNGTNGYIDVVDGSLVIRGDNASGGTQIAIITPGVGVVVTGETSESALGISNVRFGTIGGSARVIWEYAGDTVFEADNVAGHWRLFKPGIVLLDVEDDGTTTLGYSGGRTVASGPVGTAWAGLPYASGWVDCGSGWQAGQYMKLGDLVVLRGLVARTSGSSSVIATLPAGFRPAALTMISTMTGGDTPGRVDIAGDGTINLAVGNASYVNLSNVVFSIS